MLVLIATFFYNLVAMIFRKTAIAYDKGDQRHPLRTSILCFVVRLCCTTQRPIDEPPTALKCRLRLLIRLTETFLLVTEIFVLSFTSALFHSNNILSRRSFLFDQTDSGIDAFT